MTRPAISRRIAAAILGAHRQGDRPSAVAHQRRLPLGRRLLTSVLGVQERPPVSTVPPRTEPKGNAEASQTHGTSFFDSPPDTPSPPPRARHQKAGSRYTGDRVPRHTPSEGPREHGSRWPGSGSRHLLSKDRWEYDQVLDDTLRSASYHPEFAHIGRRFDIEQLRTMARDATEIITAAAATEYQHYVEVREGRSRLPSSAPPPSFHEPGSENPGTGAVRFAADTGGVHEPYSAGVAAVVAVLAPVLAGAVAAFSLLVGFLLKAFVPESAFAHILLTVGWISGAVAGVAIVVAGVGLLITALRHGPPIDTGRDGEPSGEVALARAAWREALRERGIVPFLREALADPGTAAAVHPEAPSEPTGRIPHFGYGRSGFTSPKEGPAPRSRPRFTSPDYAGPADSGPSASPEDPDETSSP